MSCIIELLDCVNNMKNQCFDIKVGPLKTVERAYIKLLVDLTTNQFFDHFNTVNLETLPGLLIQLNNRFKKLQIKDLVRAQIYVSRKQEVVDKLRQFVELNKKKWVLRGFECTFDFKDKQFNQDGIEFSVGYVTIMDKIEIQLFENRSLFLNHETYELKRLLKDKDLVYPLGNISPSLRNINKHCFSVAFSTLLQHFAK